MKKIITFFVIMSVITIFFKAQAQTACDVPTELNVDNIGTRSAHLSWAGTTDSLFVIAYKIVDSKISYNWQYKKTDLNEFTLKNLVSNANYVVYVRAYCTKNVKSEYCPLFKFTTNKTCNGASNLKVDEYASHSVKLSWNGDALEYVVRYKKVNDYNFHYAKTIAGAKTIVLSNLEANTTYEWCVKSLCVDIDTSIVNTCGGLFATSDCAAPKIIYAGDVTYHTAHISWEKSPGAMWYAVKIMYKEKDAEIIKVKKALANNIDLTGLKPDTKYTIWVGTACQKILMDASKVTKFYSDPINFTTLSKPVCPAPDGLLSSRISGTTAKVSWNLCQYAVKYKVRYYVANTTFYHYATTPAGSVPFTLSNLKPASKYIWQVATLYFIDGVLHQSEYSAPADFTTTYYYKLMSASDKINLQVYPNPSKGLFNINVDSPEKFDIEVYNITGKRVFNQNSESVDFNGSIDLTGMSQGIYLLKVRNSKDTKTSKIIIQ